MYKTGRGGSWGQGREQVYNEGPSIVRIVISKPIMGRVWDM